MSISRRSILTKIPIALASANVLKAVGVFAKVESIPHATHFGPFIAKVQNGAIKDIIPQKSDYNPTMMLKAMVDRVYSDSRVKYPCVRKSFLENKKNHKELRGREEFVRVSWDVALDLAAKKLKEIPKENIYNASYGGWWHAGSLHRCHHLAWRFFNTTLGGAIGADGEYGNGAAARINPMIVGDMEVYSQQTTHEEMIKIRCMSCGGRICSSATALIILCQTMSMMATTLSIKELVLNSSVSIPFIPKPLKPLVLNAYPFALILI
ncbi:hypothetical protein VN0666_12400 [Helicobacter pylori]